MSQQLPLQSMGGKKNILAWHVVDETRKISFYVLTQFPFWDGSLFPTWSQMENKMGKKYSHIIQKRSPLPLFWEERGGKEGAERSPRQQWGTPHKHNLNHHIASPKKTSDNSSHTSNHSLRRDNPSVNEKTYIGEKEKNTKKHHQQTHLSC